MGSKILNPSQLRRALKPSKFCHLSQPTASKQNPHSRQAATHGVNYARVRRKQVEVLCWP